MVTPLMRKRSCRNRSMRSRPISSMTRLSSMYVFYSFVLSIASMWTAVSLLTRQLQLSGLSKAAERRFYESAIRINKCRRGQEHVFQVHVDLTVQRIQPISHRTQRRIRIEVRTSRYWPDPGRCLLILVARIRWDRPNRVRPSLAVLPIVRRRCWSDSAAPRRDPVCSWRPRNIAYVWKPSSNMSPVYPVRRFLVYWPVVSWLRILYVAASAPAAAAAVVEWPEFPSTDRSSSPYRRPCVSCRMNCKLLLSHLLHYQGVLVLKLRNNYYKYVHYKYAGVHFLIISICVDHWVNNHSDTILHTNYKLYIILYIICGFFNWWIIFF